MTNQEILEKAIQKAIDGGWKGISNVTDTGRVWHYPDNEGILDWEYSDQERSFEYGVGDDYESLNLEAIIFNHDFAKALWGEEPYYRFDGDTLENPRVWEWHLQQMVIADDPIKYLGENI